MQIEFGAFQSVYPVWLLILPEENCAGKNEFLQNSKLRFDSETIVVCPRKKQVLEWYSLTGEDLQIGQLGILDFLNENEEIRFFNTTLYQRRNNLRGLKFNLLFYQVKKHFFFQKKF